MINISSWDSTKVPNDLITSANYNSGVTDQKTRVPSTSGAGAPSSTPTVVPSVYFDTTNKKYYFAVDTSSSADWKKVILSS